MDGSEALEETAWLPVRDRRFWMVQVLIALVFMLHELDAGNFGIPAFAPVPHLAVEALFVLPLLYAALNFGLRGSLITAAWVTVLMGIDITADLGRMSDLNRWAHYVELGTLDLMAVVVGRGVQIQARARRRAEASEARYRQVYEAARVPILVLDAQGVVRDVNPAGRAVFGEEVIGRSEQDLVPGGLLSPGQARGVFRLPDGRDYRAEAVWLTGEGGALLAQVILEDITEEHRERLQARRYAAFVVQADEDHRRRLARELHDEPLQLLLYLARQLDALAGGQDVPAGVAGHLAGARAQALDAAIRLRSLTGELRPPALDDLGVAAALSNLLFGVQEDSGLDTELRVIGERQRVAPDAELALYRIAQEAVRNALLHAEARRIEVIVEFGRDELGITVADDGQGFTPGGLDEPPQVHFGLLGMHERASLLGGHLEVRSAPSTGTVVEARLPLFLGTTEDSDSKPRSALGGSRARPADNPCDHDR